MRKQMKRDLRTIIKPEKKVKNEVKVKDMEYEEGKKKNESKRQ